MSRRRRSSTKGHSTNATTEVHRTAFDAAAARVPRVDRMAASIAVLMDRAMEQLLAARTRRSSPTVVFTPVRLRLHGHDYRGVLVRGEPAWMPEGAALAVVAYKIREEVWRPHALSRARAWLAQYNVPRDLDALSIGALRSISHVLQSAFDELTVGKYRSRGSLPPSKN